MTPARPILARRHLPLAAVPLPSAAGMGAVALAILPARRALRRRRTVAASGGQ